MTKQMEQIWEDHHNQEVFEAKLLKIKRDKKRKEKEEELGL